MTKKEYCMKHDPTASHDYYVSHIHGVEDTPDGTFIYVSRRAQIRLGGSFRWTFHRVKLYLNRDGEYYFWLPAHTFDGKTLRVCHGVNSYIRRGEWLPLITSAEIFDNE